MLTNVTRRGLNTAIFIAMSLAFLALFVPFGGPHAVALTASVSALAMLTSGLLQRARVLPLAGCTEAAHGEAAARSSFRDVRVLPQRDPDAAGKPHPRAPGSSPSTV